MKNLIFISLLVMPFTSISQADMDSYDEVDFFDESGLSVKETYITPMGDTMFVYEEFYDTLGVYMLLEEADRVLESYDVFHNLDLSDFFDGIVESNPDQTFEYLYQLSDGGQAFIELLNIDGTEYKMVRFGIRYKGYL